MQIKRLPRSGLNRRSILKGLGATSAALVTGTLPRPAIAQSLKKVTIVYGVQTMQSAAEGYFSSIPIGLGFYRDEGLEVEVQNVAGSSAALNLLASGQALVTTHGTAGLFSGVAQGIDMQGFICQIPEYFCSIGVLAEGPIKTFEDLRGKTIGINAEQGSPHLVLQAVFKKLGWVEGTDFSYQSVGTALPALDALRRDRIQGLASWDTVFAGFEFQGQEFRYFRPEPIPTMGFTHSSNALRSSMKSDPQTFAGLTRAMNKATVYMAAAQPEELTKLHFKIYPASQPTGMPEAEALRLDKLRQTARGGFMRYKERVFDRTERLGDISDEEISGNRDLLVAGGVIPEGFPPDRYFTREFLDKGNDFDIAALVEKAKAFRA